jgi:type II secretory pathway component PulF
MNERQSNMGMITSVLLGVMLAGLFGFLYLVVPRWKASLADLGVELATWQIWLLALSDFVVQKFWFLVPAVAVLYAFTCRAMTRPASSSRPRD